MDNKRDVTVEEIAKEINITEAWVRVLAREGKIPGTKKGHYWYFNVDEVKEAHFKNNNFTPKVL